MGEVLEERLSFLELTKYITGKKKWDKPYTGKCASNEELELFTSILSSHSAFSVLAKSCGKTSNLFSSVEGLNELFDKEVRDDLFYSFKVGYRLIGVPSLLIYLLTMAKDMYVYPNKALSKIDRSLLLQFTAEGVLPDDMTVYDVMCNVWKSQITLLSPYRKRSKFVDVCEVYVEKFVNHDTGEDEVIDEVALLSHDIASALTDTDLRQLVLDSEEGLVSGKRILRLTNNKYGIVTDDLDLTGVV